MADGIAQDAHTHFYGEKDLAIEDSDAWLDDGAGSWEPALRSNFQLEVWVALASTLLVQGIAVWGLLCYYGRSGRRGCGLMFVAWLAVHFALALVMLLPADVSVVSNLDDIVGDDDLELDGKLRAIRQRTQIVQYASYALWVGSAGLSLFVVPFVYFFYEEEELYGFEVQRTGTQTSAALKYVVLFALILGVLVGVALGLKPGLSVDDLSADPDFDWVAKWTQVRPQLAQAFNFLMMATSCVGLLSWVCYTAVGMAYLPIDILKGQGHVDRLQATIEEREALLGNRYAQIREKAWRQGIGSLSRRERRDAEVSEQSRLRLDRDRKDLRRSQTALNSCMNRCPILRYLCGVVLLLLTLLVFEAVAITAIDVTNHNTGLQRGFVMTEGSLKDFNLLNTILSLSCEAGTGTFGDIYLTAVRFAGPGILTLHIVCCTIYGMFTIGLCRSCRIKPHRTLPQSLLVAVVVVVFTLYGVVLTLPAMAPQFFDYGCQKQPGLVEADPPRECTRGAPSPYCINTQFSLVSTWMRLSLPPLGVLVFAANWAFVGMLLVALGAAAFRTRATNADDLSDDDD